MIKYKGNTSALLKDLCIELNIPVNLKHTEEILKHFFDTAFANVDTEKSIQLMTNLPACLKPFYRIPKSNSYIQKLNGNHLQVSFKAEKDFTETYGHLFTPNKISATTKSIIHVLDKYIPATNLAIVLTLIPEQYFYERPVYTKVAV